jgi:phage-related protein
LPKLIKIITDSAPEILKTVSTLALEITKGMISSLPELVSAILLIANDLIRTITEELPNIVNAIVEVVPDLVQALTDPEMFNQLMEGSIALMMAIVDAIPVIIQALIPQIPTIIDNIITILMDNIPMMLDAAIQMYMALISAIPIMIQELIPALGQIWDSIYENLVVPASEKLGEMWNGIKDGAATAWKGIKNVFKNAGEWYSINVIKPIKDKFAGVWKKLKTGAVDAWDGIKEAFGTVGTWFRDTFTEAWQNVKDVFSTGGEVFSGITEGITEAFKDVVNTLIRGINIVVSQPFDSINDMLQTLRDFSFAGKHPFEDFPWLDTPQIPELARGGIVNGRSFIAGEDGAEAIIPLERNTEGLKKIAQLLAAEMSSGKTSAGASYIFNQTNNSPKALSRYEIYRQTRNLVAMAKGV